MGFEFRTKGDGQPLGLYLLYDDSGLYLAFGFDCVSAAKSLNVRLGRTAEPYDMWSVSGSWDAVDGMGINVGRWWPHFTANPPERYLNREHRDRLG